MAAQAESRSITPKLPRALPDAARKKVTTAIESHLEAVQALTAFLDQTDADADLEDGGDAEPSLGSQDPMWESHNQELWAQGTTADLEVDVHDEPHDPDPDEPSLAHTNDFDQAMAKRNLCGEFKAALNDDCEQQCEDEGADEHYARHMSGTGAL